MKPLMAFLGPRKQIAQDVKGNDYAGLFYRDRLQLKIFGSFAEFIEPFYSSGVNNNKTGKTFSSSSFRKVLAAASTQGGTAARFLLFFGKQIGDVFVESNRLHA